VSQIQHLIVKQDNDQHLLTALQQGDETAFDALFRKWYEPLVRYAATMADGDVDEAEDLVQQVFVKFWEQREALVVQYSTKAYLYRMVHNRALNRMRSFRAKERYSDHQIRIMENTHEPSPDSMDSELQQRYKKALTLLPPQCRQVFELSRFEELKYREIADQLGISIKTVETQMGKALKMLRHELADYLVTLLILLAI
jgi:RNA polymerase sigma-70 factor, ECF subfamily